MFRIFCEAGIMVCRSMRELINIPRSNLDLDFNLTLNLITKSDLGHVSFRLMIYKNISQTAI